MIIIDNPWLWTIFAWRRLDGDPRSTPRMGAQDCAFGMWSEWEDRSGREPRLLQVSSAGSPDNPDQPVASRFDLLTMVDIHLSSGGPWNQGQILWLLNSLVHFYWFTIKHHEPLAIISWSLSNNQALTTINHQRTRWLSSLHLAHSKVDQCWILKYNWTHHIMIFDTPYHHLCLPPFTSKHEPLQLQLLLV